MKEFIALVASAVQAQPGLEMESTEQPVEALAADRAEKPSEN